MEADKGKPVVRFQVAEPEVCLKLLASLLGRLPTRGCTNHAYLRLVVEKGHTSCPAVVRAECQIFKIVLCIFPPFPSDHYLGESQEGINPF